MAPYWGFCRKIKKQNKYITMSFFHLFIQLFIVILGVALRKKKNFFGQNQTVFLQYMLDFSHNDFVGFLQTTTHM